MDGEGSFPSDLVVPALVNAVFPKHEQAGLKE